MNWGYYKYDRVEIHLKDEKISSIINLNNQKEVNSFSQDFKEKDIPKIYLIKNLEKYLYVGATVQPIHTKLKGGLQGNSKYGYHGYKWKNQKIVECFVWAFKGFNKEQIEAVEAELVFQIRSKYGRWTEYQNEIHFNNNFELSKDISKEIFKYIERKYPLKSNYGYKKNTEFIFEEPFQYGLRGDPYLWKDIRVRYEYSNVNNQSEFRNLMLKAFKENTGSLPEKGKNYFVKQFNFGGMSSGRVNSDFWIEKGFPMLEERFMKMNK